MFRMYLSPPTSPARKHSSACSLGHVPLKRRLNIMPLYDDMAQKIDLLVTIGVRTSNNTCPQTMGRMVRVYSFSADIVSRRTRRCGSFVLHHVICSAGFILFKFMVTQLLNNSSARFVYLCICLHCSVMC